MRAGGWRTCRGWSLSLYSGLEYAIDWNGGSLEGHRLARDFSFTFVPAGGAHAVHHLPGRERLRLQKLLSFARLLAFIDECKPLISATCNCFRLPCSAGL